MYKCRQCGCEYDLKPRFCPKCGSYFIDANDASDGYEWKGVIGPDGTISRNVKVQKKHGPANGKYALEMTTGERVWGILCIVFSAHALMNAAFAGLIDISFMVLMVPFFILGVVGTKNTFGTMKRVGLILLLLSLIILVLSIIISSD